MDLKNFFKRQLRTVVECKEQDPGVLFHLMETSTDEIKNASKLIVAPGQGCLVVYDGRVRATLTEPGTYEMETANHPFITTLLNLAQQLESEHKMRFYFFRTAEMVNVLWGTASPVKYMEPVYHLPVALGACGNFSVRIAEPDKMFTTLLGTVSNYRDSDVRELVSSRIVAPLTSFLAEKAYPYQEVDSHLLELSTDLKTRTAEELARLGLELTDFRVDSVTFDDDTMERIGKIADMTAEQQAAAEVGLDYTDVQKLGALRDAARNEGGLAGAGLQLGAGVQLAKDIFKQPEANGGQAAADAPAEPSADATQRLRQLKTMLDEQLITQDEYDKKKEEILARL
ncbi:SPFH domain-containing protein [Prevotella sp. kh1p2]|uniref:SPFH domain-containing protein n=1 Tax=Prevotella sp. kh1p2 TaxID=1761883 RepID=UPI0008CB61D3|nr:SPFH domain-containing protein [Prevotella sp. kh1p2]SES89639.1 Membrane protease subunit, stomatin/prohibitin family, contains C-terminal Zn-ribbon domain [Prevotella sp. kh1p2]SNU11630.1 Membrane protease subunit, stomatin/prohibitin family, contains C-terminal Zn-ribbon domain [Prevotellaceae bacterium KH2P17]